MYDKIHYKLKKKKNYTFLFSFLAIFVWLYLPTLQLLSIKEVRWPDQIHPNVGLPGKKKIVL